ncbi:phosphodiester glycosidase family protein [uncultured Aquimarina sp.]|uniref:phosphodiester glycosidase family protein n=1 Tax=uncultured Aquimarina sp. TaxID=575652 RepID=UPI00260C7BA8|nr:phosphodiester glycosidase family protein [uncultured Aquimarina sp.]
MKNIVTIFFLALCLVIISFTSLKESNIENKFISYEINLKYQNLRFYWKNDNDKNYGNFQNLKSELQKNNQELIFAMNGGMYNKDLSPQGLYIENSIIKSKIDTLKNGYGNFYLQPNGIFYITKDNKPAIHTTTSFKNDGNIKYATQSGPMLLIDGRIHPKFNLGSPNIHIRNGVGILPNGNLLFAMSKEKINFYDFASYFKDNGCKNALYLDGFVSRTYLPSANWEQLEGNFGVIILKQNQKNRDILFFKTTIDYITKSKYSIKKPVKLNRLTGLFIATWGGCD